MATLNTTLHPHQQKGYPHVRAANRPKLTAEERAVKLRAETIEHLRKLPAYHEEKREAIPLSTKARPDFDPPLKFILAGCTKAEFGAHRHALKEIANCKRQIKMYSGVPGRKWKDDGRNVRLLLAEHNLHQIIRKLKDSWRGTYSDHIASPKWKAFRRAILAERGAACEDCKSDGNGMALHIHHLTYERMGREVPEDVRILCVPCHERRHH